MSKIVIFFVFKFAAKIRILLELLTIYFHST